MTISICVFCGSSSGGDSRFAESALLLGEEIGRRGHRLIYGGSHLGLMGVLADAVLASGGEVTGVMPRLLVEKEAAYLQLDDLRIVGSMHERKALMVDLAQAFVALPGAYGTLDELFECLTWAQLGVHQKPIVVWNVANYFDSLFAFLDHVEASALLRPQHRTLLRSANTIEELFAYLSEPVSASPGKWLPSEIR